MPNIRLTITIPSGVYNSCADYWKYSTTMKDNEGNSVLNSESKEEFMEKKTLSFFGKAHEANKGKINSEAARITAINDAKIEAEEITIISEEIE